MRELEWAITLNDVEKSDFVLCSDVYGDEEGINFGPDRSINKDLITVVNSIIVSTLAAKETFKNVKSAWEEGETVNVEINFMDGDEMEIPLERFRLREHGDWSELWLWMSVVANSGW